ncbi:MAG: lipoprotein-releasing system transmembrane subunit LolC, partial [Candidatus Delongbacteria bacterium]|nr:lipoprotein-releasing system transmembrane subunit LolC [Candidatus Delongbacteria bacterium]
MPSFELFIAKRYIKSKSKTAFISTITYISFFGIMLGVAVLSIVMSVMNGFETEVKTRFIANDSHL